MYEHPNVRPLSPLEHELLRADREIERLRSVVSSQSTDLIARQACMLVLMCVLTANQ